MNTEDSREILSQLLQEKGYRFEVLCFHVWIPDYFNKTCGNIRKKIIPPTP